MATIGGLTTSTSSSIRGYGGLASGLDRDTLIEGMTSGTTSKITQQQKKQQQLEWKQAAVQNISSKLIDFANKYTSSWSSSTNLFSSMFWGRNKITTTGENSKYVSVSGTASSSDGVTIMGVKQMAQKAKWSSSGLASEQSLSTGDVKMDKTYKKKHLVGTDIDFKVGSDTSGGSAPTYTLSLKASKLKADGSVEKNYDYSTPDAAVASIKEQMQEVDITINGKSMKLSEAVDISYDDTTKKFAFSRKQGTGTDAFSISGGTALTYLGFKESQYKLEQDVVDKDGNVTEDHKVKSDQETNLTRDVLFPEIIAEKGLTFSYNGVTKEIYMPSQATLEAANTNEAKLKAIETSMQEQMDSAFGKGRIKVEAKDGKITLKTMDPSEKDKADTTSTLTLVSGNLDVTDALNISTGASNRVNMNASLGATLKAKGVKFEENADIRDENGNLVKERNKTSFTLNGKEIEVYDDDTMSSLMERINNTKGAGVSIAYHSAADKFTITSTEDGASGTIKFGKDWTDAKYTNMSADELKAAQDEEKLLLNSIFGEGTYGSEEIRGKDAIVAVKYAGADDEVVLTRGTNSFTVDGLTINVKGEFGYKEVQAKDNDGNLLTNEDGTPKMIKERDKTAEAIEIDAQVDADSIVEGVKAMIEEYNSIIELVNKEVTTKPDRDYEPLTSEQKKELTDDEIETWEKKAKEGILYADSDIRSLSSDLRFIISGGFAQELANMGISTSSTYSDNGKITFDESKFRAALASDPERVQEIFANESVQNTNGKGYSAGVATTLKNVLDKYVNTVGSMDSKGILIRKAGSESSPMSVTENTIYKQLAEIKKKITSLQEQLETERDRYIKQFTSLETLISQMNSQSSWLSQFGSY